MHVIKETLPAGAFYDLSWDWIEMYSVTESDRRLYNSHKETIDTSASTRAELPVRTVGLMPEPKIRLQVNVAVATEAEGARVGEDFQVAVCTGVVEQAF